MFVRVLVLMVAFVTSFSPAFAANEAGKRECRSDPAALLGAFSVSMSEHGYPASEVKFLTNAVSARVTNAFADVALNEEGKECGRTGIKRIVVGCLLQGYPGILADVKGKDLDGKRVLPTLKHYGRKVYSVREGIVLALLEGCIGYAKGVFAR